MTIKVIPFEQLTACDLKDGHAYIDSKGDLVLCLSVCMGAEYITMLWYPHDNTWYAVDTFIPNSIRYKEVNVEIAVKG